MEDIQIIEFFWDRNQSAITETGIKYGCMLHRISYGVLMNKEDSEECVNDTYAKAWDTMPPQKPCSLAAYLGRIARNISINRWHKNHAQKRGGNISIQISELSDCVPAQSSVESEIETNALTGVIEKWLESLPGYDRVLFLRRYWFSEELNSLAEECGSSPNKLAGRLFRLRQKLKSTLEEEGITL